MRNTACPTVFVRGETHSSCFQNSLLAASRRSCTSIHFARDRCLLLGQTVPGMKMGWIAAELAPDADKHIYKDQLTVEVFRSWHHEAQHSLQYADPSKRICTHPTFFRFDLSVLSSGGLPQIQFFPYLP